MWRSKDTFKCYGQVFANFCPYIVYTHACTTTPKHTDLSSYTPPALSLIGFPSIDLSALSALHQLLHYFLFIYHWMNPCSLFPAHPPKKNFFLPFYPVELLLLYISYLFRFLSRLRPCTIVINLALLLLEILLNANRWAFSLFFFFCPHSLPFCSFHPLLCIFFSSRQCVNLSVSPCVTFYQTKFLNKFFLLFFF